MPVLVWVGAQHFLLTPPEHKPTLYAPALPSARAQGRASSWQWPLTPMQGASDPIKGNLKIDIMIYVKFIESPPPAISMKVFVSTKSKGGNLQSDQEGRAKYIVRGRKYTK